MAQRYANYLKLMRTAFFLFLFLGLLSCPMPLQSQTVLPESDAADTVVERTDWQQQMLESLDPDELSEEGYARLLEMLDDLDLERQWLRSDSVSDGGRRRNRPRQTLSVGLDRCLNLRDGYRDATTERRDAGKAYLGDATHTTLRYNLALADSHSATWRAGLVLDKDAGEAWHTRLPLADSYSLYAALTRRRGIVRQVCIGHYRLTLGTGLLCDQSFALGKNLQGASLMSVKPTLAVHSSASETDFMQGAAVRLRLGERWELVPFLSARPIDGTLASDTLTAWKSDGYHRTRTEDSKRGAAWAPLRSARSADAPRARPDRERGGAWRRGAALLRHVVAGVQVLELVDGLRVGGVLRGRGVVAGGERRDGAAGLVLDGVAEDAEHREGGDGDDDDDDDVFDHGLAGAAGVGFHGSVVWWFGG